MVKFPFWRVNISLVIGISKCKEDYQLKVVYLSALLIATANLELLTEWDNS